MISGKYAGAIAALLISLAPLTGFGTAPESIPEPAAAPALQTEAHIGSLDLGFSYEIDGRLDEKGDFSTILKYLLFAFAGGLILNVMPCVLPVLSIKAMTIVNAAHQDQKEIFKGSMAYTAGILASFAVLATLASIGKLAGETAGWGTQMQSFGFVFTLFVVVWVFSLALFDVFVIQLPGMQAASQASARKGHLGSFLSGIFAVLLATPCTAPLLAPAVAFLMNLPIPYIFLAFTAIGLGLAFPFILLGLFPAAMRFIPKPGNWMNTFKELMGFLMLATAVFLAFILQKMLGEDFFKLLVFLIPLSLSCWMYGKFAGPVQPVAKQWIYTLLALAISIGSGFMLIDPPKPATEGEHDELNQGWLRFSPGQIDRARAQNKPMLIDPDSSWSKGTGRLAIEEKDGALLIRSTEQAFGQTRKLNLSDIVAMRDETRWKPFSPERLRKALVEEKRPVFIDFGAVWCTSCHANENAVLYTESVMQAFQKRNVLTMKADYTNYAPELTEFINNFGGAGVPFYLLFVPGETVQVITFPTILSTKADFIHRLRVLD